MKKILILVGLLAASQSFGAWYDNPLLKAKVDLGDWSSGANGSDPHYIDLSESGTYLMVGLDSWLDVYPTKLFRAGDLAAAAGDVADLAFKTVAPDARLNQKWKGGAVSEKWGVAVSGSGNATGHTVMALGSDASSTLTLAKKSDGLDFDAAGNLYGNNADAKNQLVRYSFSALSAAGGTVSATKTFDTSLARVRNVSVYTVGGKALVFCGEGDATKASKGKVVAVDIEAAQEYDLVTTSLASDIMNVKVIGLAAGAPKLCVLSANGELAVYALAADGLSVTDTTPLKALAASDLNLGATVAADGFRSFEITDDGNVAYLVLGQRYSSESKTYLYVLADQSAARSLVRVAYATEGLVTALDGIENDGQGKDHVANPANWKEFLSSRDCTFTKASGDYGKWEKKGYRFDKSYLSFPSQINLGSGDATIQIVCNFDNSKYPTSNYWPNLISRTDTDSGIYTAGRGNELNWKIDGETLNGSSNRPKLSGWSFKYVNAMLKGGYAYLFQSETSAGASGKQLKSGASLGTKTWIVGSGTAGLSARYANMLLFAVRFYNRALTDRELSDNRLLDDMRYRDTIADNVLVVASSCVGVTSVGCSDGVYRLTGDTLVAAGTGRDAAGNTYVCDGYTLETWNASQKTWDHTDDTSSTSITVPGGTAKRLIVHWKLLAGKLALDVGAYPQFGLLMHYDGIRNQGADKPHDKAATTWVDVAGKGGTATFKHLYAPEAYWTPNGFELNGAGCMEGANKVDPGTQFTIQLATDYVNGYQVGRREGKTGNCFPRIFCDTGYGSSTSDYACRLYTDFNGKLNFFEDNTTGLSWDKRATVDAWSGQYITAISDYAKSYLFAGVTKTEPKVGTFKTAIGERTWVWGAIDHDIPSGSNEARHNAMYGTIHSVRMYDRVLSDAELQRARELDEIRFRNRIPAKNVVVVESRVPDAGDGTCTAYLIAGAGSWTFAAPQAKAGYTFTGYTMETMDAYGNWSSATKAAGTSCTVMSAESEFASVRIVWECRGNSFGKTYTTADYVQDGLVAHYDALNNTGVGHSSDELMWRDLSSRGDRLVFTDKGTVSARWKDDACTFNNNGYAQMRNPLNLGPVFTVQGVLDVPVGANAQTTAYPNLFTVNSDLGVFMYKGLLTTLNFKETWGGCATRLSGYWTGTYFNAIMGDEFAAVFRNTDYVNKQPRTKWTPVGEQKWSFGGAYQSDLYADRSIKGDYHAVRIYNRQLTEAELAWNRVVDENRYRGGPLATTNVLVCSSSRWAKGSEDGAYLQQGSHVFTAEDVVDKKGRLWRVVGYTLSTFENGQWSSPIFTADKSCEITIGDESKPVRLMWKFQGPGLCLFIH